MIQLLRPMTPALILAGLCLPPSLAGAQAPPPYGPSIALDQAKKAVAGAEAEAKKNNWPVVIVILDSGGNLVMLERLDNTQWGSVEVAKDKTRSAVGFRRSTKVFSDLLAQGGANVRLLNLSGASMIEGGIPIIADGKIIGGIGVSGVTAQQDAQIARRAVCQRPARRAVRPSKLRRGRASRCGGPATAR